MQTKLRNLLSAFLAVMMVFGMFAAMPIMAGADFAHIVDAQLNSFKAFQKVNTFTGGQFADVSENDWYGINQQGVVANAYEYGLMKGTSGTAFNPTGNMTIAEAITIAVRVHSIYNGGNGEFVQGIPWYQVYVDYAVANGIIASATFSNYETAVTRAEMAYIFARTSVPVELVYNEMHGPANIVNSLPDVNNATPYHDEIIRLYEAGILTGSDTQGTFHPSNSITRVEAAAIISRVILPETRFSDKTFG